MRVPRAVYIVVVGAVLVSLHAATGAFAQQPIAGATGSSMFGTYCATCHGTSAKGDGPLAASMTKRPADLTRIAARNGGVFPPDLVALIIDGRHPVKGHGSSEMPIWGDAFSRSSDALAPAERIRRLVSHLESIQVK